MKLKTITFSSSLSERSTLIVAIFAYCVYFAVETTILNKTFFLLSTLPFVKGFSFKCWVIIPVRNESKKHDSYRIYKQTVWHWMSNFLFVSLLLLLLFFCVGGQRWFRKDHWCTSKAFHRTVAAVIHSAVFSGVFLKGQLGRFSKRWSPSWSWLTFPLLGYIAVVTALMFAVIYHIIMFDLRCMNPEILKLHSWVGGTPLHLGLRPSHPLLSFCWTLLSYSRDWWNH